MHDAHYHFEVGKADLLAPGNDMTLFATGGAVANALKAKTLLQASHIDARVINVPTLKPIDSELILQCARETRCLFTVEDHSIIGGLGSAVAEVTAEHYPVPVKRWGILDTFGQSGSEKDLYHAYQIDTEGIAAAATAFYHQVTSGIAAAS